MSTKDPKLTRRALLAATGLGGASLFLPSLARKGRAQTMAPPKRLVIFYTLHGTVYDAWKMRRPGLDETSNWELPLDDPDPASFSEVLRPLHGVRSDLLVLDGIAQITAIGDIVFNNHSKGRIHSLTGSPMVQIGGGVATASGASIDQIVAQGVRRPDRLSSLALYGFGSDPIVYSGRDASLPFTGDPLEVFDRLFPGGSSTPTTPSNADRVRTAQANVLDFVRGEFDQVKPRLGAEDQRKLDIHRDLVRDLQSRLGALGSVTCQAPQRPVRIPPSDYNRVYEAFSQIAAAAAACDLTRVITIGMPQLPNSLCGAPPGDIHADFAHHEGENAQATTVMTNYHRAHAQHFRQLIDLFKAIPEGNGTLLDSSLLVWMNELATGRHLFYTYPVVMAGGALRKGRYVRWAPTIPTADPHPTWANVAPFTGPGHNKLLVSIARACGVDVNQVGSANIRSTSTGQTIDLTGPLDRLT